MLKGRGCNICSSAAYAYNRVAIVTCAPRVQWHSMSLGMWVTACTPYCVRTHLGADNESSAFRDVTAPAAQRDISYCRIFK